MITALVRYSKSIIVLAILLDARSSNAQIEFKEPFYTHRDNISMSIGKVTVKPTSMLFQIEYHGGGAWKLMYNTSYYNFLGKPYLQIIGGGQFSLTDGTVPAGVPASRYDQYAGPARTSSPPKKKTLMVEFPFSAGKMFFNIFNDRYIKYDNSLYLNFSECSVKNPVKEWTPGCINFQNIQLPFTHKQLHILYLNNYLTLQGTKGEFETTEAFQARTHPDSLFKSLARKYQELEDVFRDQYRSRISTLKPAVKYNADKQQFTVSYVEMPIEPIVISVPLAEAEAFKNDVQNRSLAFDNWQFFRTSEDRFAVSQLDVSDRKSKRKTYENLAAGSAGRDEVKEFRRSVFKELEKQLPKGKRWTYIE